MALHPVFVHFHTGILAACAVLALINIVLRLVFRDAIRTPGTRMSRIFHEFDVFIFWGTVIGIIGMVVAMITGFMDWPLVALLNDPLMRFKILWSGVALQIYVAVFIVRAKLGDRVWEGTSSFLIYGGLVVVGGLLIVLIAAMGGIAEYGVSILSPLLKWLGLPWP